MSWLIHSVLSTLSHGIVITKTKEAINFKKEFYVIIERDEDGYFVREVLQILSIVDPENETMC